MGKVHKTTPVSATVKVFSSSLASKGSISSQSVSWKQKAALTPRDANTRLNDYNWFLQEISHGKEGENSLRDEGQSLVQ
jgi:hypothetical protein